MTLPEPGPSVDDPVARLVEYLDFFRAEVRRTSTSVPPQLLDRSIVPSGWTVPGLVEHLVRMERRWLVWGFLGHAVTDPTADRDADDRWVTTRALPQLLDDLDAGGRRTREIVAAHDPLDRATPGGKYGAHDELPTLLGILFHVVQEHARHAGHLDIVVELLGGVTGDD